MLEIYQALIKLATSEFKDIVTHTTFIGGTLASPNKLRIVFTDDSFLDIWISIDNDYAYHWEQRRQRGRLYRWDNAPHHPQVNTHPAHFHNGDELTVIESHLNSVPENALCEILSFVRKHL